MLTEQLGTVESELWVWSYPATEFPPKTKPTNILLKKMPRKRLHSLSAMLARAESGQRGVRRAARGARHAPAAPRREFLRRGSRECGA